MGQNIKILIPQSKAAVFGPENFCRTKFLASTAIVPTQQNHNAIAQNTTSRLHVSDTSKHSFPCLYMALDIEHNHKIGFL